MKGKTLDILIPQYNEDEKVIKPLLDSINNQRGINFDDIRVIIVNDGSKIILSDKFLNSYNFEIHYILNEHKGVSETRNCCLRNSDAPYVMFCDADDCMFSVLFLYNVFNLINMKQYDIIFSQFLEEIFSPTKNKLAYMPHDEDITFMHGKVFRRQFLKDNNIEFEPSFIYHEDGYFNFIAFACAKHLSYIKEPQYLWCYNKNSVVRGMKSFVFQTYDHLLRAQTKTIEELLKRNKASFAQKTFVLNCYQTYYTLTGKFALVPENKDKITKLKEQFKVYYDSYKYLLKDIDQAVIDKVKANTKGNAVRLNYFAESDLSYEDFINSL